MPLHIVLVHAAANKDAFPYLLISLVSLGLCALGLSLAFSIWSCACDLVSESKGARLCHGSGMAWLF